MPNEVITKKMLQLSCYVFWSNSLPLALVLQIKDQKRETEFVTDKICDNIKCRTNDCEKIGATGEMSHQNSGKANFCLS